MMHEKISAAYAPPFGTGKVRQVMFPPGTTLGEMIATFGDVLPSDFAERGMIRVNDHEIDRAYWHKVKPKPESNDRPITVTFHYALQGGGDGGGAGKQIIGVVAALALTVATGGIAGGALATSGGLFAAGSFSAKVLAGAVGLAGALAISALTAPPAVKSGASSESNRQDDDRVASLSGNAVIEPGGTVPRVIGTHKAFPPVAGEPVIAIEGQDDILEAAFCLNGPHDLDDIRAGGSPIEDEDDIEVQTREGWEDDPQIDLFNRYGRTSGSSTELSRHQVQPENADRLADQADPLKSLPVWQGVPTRESPDEVWLRLHFQGLLFQDNANQLAVPFRVRIRKRGESSWVHLPEFHVAGYQTALFKTEIQIKWDADEPGLVAANPVPSADGVVAAFHTTFAQASPPRDAWTAHSYFDAGSGDDYLYRGNESSSGVRHVFLYSNRIEIYLDSATFPKGMYDIQVMRGYAFAWSSFSPSAYTLGGTVRDPFGYYLSGSTAIIGQTQSGILDKVSLARTTNIWNAPILPKPGFATIAIRARNKQIDSVSCVASGYVKDWSGSAWDNWTTTSNPAPHYRDVHIGRQNVDPLPEGLLDNDEILDWRTDCAAKGYTCDAVIDGQTIDEVRALIASCGYARPYQSELWGVIRDRDRSSDAIVQTFTPRTARGFSFEKAFARLPDGFRVQFRDSDLDYENNEIIVYRPDYDGGEDGMLESVSYGGLVTEAKVRARASFDLLQAELRSTFYRWEAPANAIVCRRGSLVALEHDTLDRHTGRALVKSVTLDDTEDFVTSFTVDSKLDIRNTPAMHDIADMLEVEDMLEVGARTAFAIRRTDGTITTHLTSAASDGETKTITPVVPLANHYTSGSFYDIAQGNPTIPEIAPGCLVYVGPHRSVHTRVIVTEMQAKDDLVFDMVGVDEAPSLWATLAFAEFSAVGTLSVSPIIVKYRSVAFAGEGSLDVMSTGATPRDVSFSAEGTLSIAPIANFVRAVSMDGLGSLTINSDLGTDRSVSFAATGALSVAPIRVKYRTVSFSAEGELLAAFNVAYQRAAAFSADGSLAVAPQKSINRSISMSGTGTLSATFARGFDSGFDAGFR